MIRLGHCAGCGQPIYGKYIQAANTAWHTDCFRCAGCGELINAQGFMQKGKGLYHPACYQARFGPRCAACKQPIEGKYVRALRKLWHPEHFCCTHCGKPIDGSFSAHRGKAYCQQDYQLLFGKKCALCGQVLVDRYLEDAWGNRYCARHADEPRCSSCERLIGQRLTGGGAKYPDGRIICGECQKTAVNEIQTARHVLEKVRSVLSEHDLQINLQQLPLQMVGCDELKKSLPKHLRDAQVAGSTLTQVETIFRKETCREIKRIQVLTGLPVEHLGAVLAHELGHTWLFINRFPPLPRKVEEGICEVFASLWLRAQKTQSASYRLKMLEKNPNPFYGRGYRAAKWVIARSSLASLLDYVRRHADFPGK